MEVEEGGVLLLGKESGVERGGRGRLECVCVCVGGGGCGTVGDCSAGACSQQRFEKE